MHVTQKPPKSPARWLRGVGAPVTTAAVALGIVAACGSGGSGSAQVTHTVTATPPTVTVTTRVPSVPASPENSSLPSPSESTDSASQTSYLSELDPLTTTTGVDTEAAEINGTGFARSVTLAANSGSPVNSAEYNLDRHWNTFSAAVGLRDDSPTGGRLTFEVSVDGRLKFRKELPLGKSKNINLDVTDALRLKLTVTYSGKDLNTFYGSWGDARLQEYSATPSNSSMNTG